MDAVEDALGVGAEAFVGSGRRTSFSREAAEAERLSIDESLSDIERFEIMLSPSADPLQHSHALSSLSELLALHGGPALRALYGQPALPLFPSPFFLPSPVASSHPSLPAQRAGTLDRAMRKFDAELVCMLADGLTESVVSNYLASSDVHELVLPCALTALRNASDRDSLEAWANLASACLPHLPALPSDADLVELAVSAGSVEQPAHSRVLACKLLGAVAPYASCSTYHSLLKEPITRLCQDTDSEVRAAMCNQLVTLHPLLGSPHFVEQAQPLLEELASDEEAHVRGMVLTVLTLLLQKLPAETCKATVVPLMLRCVSEVSDPQRVTPLTDYKGWCIASRLAKLFQQLEESHLLQLQHNRHSTATVGSGLNLFVKAWANLGRSADAEVRRLVAEAIPSVIHAVGARQYEQSVHVTLDTLAGDPDSNVRAEVSGLLGTVAGTIGNERSHKLLKQPVLKLLSDTDSYAPDRIAPSIPAIAKQFKASERSVRIKTLTELFSSMVGSVEHFEELMNWRGEQHVMAGLSEIADSLPNDKLYELVFPMCIRCLNQGAVPLRHQAAQTLCVTMQQCKRIQRREMSLRLVKDFARSRSCLQRIIFADLCGPLMERFSARYFRDVFMQASVDLLADKVSTVRLAACPLILEMRRRVRLVEDTSLFEQLNHNAIQCTKDTDKSVREAVDSVYSSFKTIGDYSKQSAAWLAEDAKKEEYEEPELNDSINIAKRATTPPASSSPRQNVADGVLHGKMGAQGSPPKSSTSGRSISTMSALTMTNGTRRVRPEEGESVRGSSGTGVKQSTSGIAAATATGGREGVTKGRSSSGSATKEAWRQLNPRAQGSKRGDRHQDMP